MLSFMAIRPCPVPPRIRHRHCHRDSGLHFVLAGDNNAFSGREALVNDRTSVYRSGYLDFAQLGFVVGIDRVGIEAFSSALNRIVRHHGRIFQRRDEQPC